MRSSNEVKGSLLSCVDIEKRVRTNQPRVDMADYLELSEDLLPGDIYIAR